VSATPCQSCGQNPATIHFTEIVRVEDRDESRTLHVCEACANAQGLTTGTTIPPLLEELVKGPRAPSAPSVKCPECGITFEEFKSKGRFGCPKDYEVFREPLAPLLAKIHDGARRHKGRLPRGRASMEGGSGDRLLRLRRQLRMAVAGENYEEAARLRDEIRTVEGGGAPEAHEAGSGSEGEGGRGPR
jgi:protein arginine kinase activator